MGWATRIGRQTAPRFDPSLPNAVQDILILLPTPRHANLHEELAKKFVLRIPWQFLPLQDCVDLSIFLVRTIIELQRWMPSCMISTCEQADLLVRRIHSSIRKAEISICFVHGSRSDHFKSAGRSCTREVAKEMLRSGRPPRDNSDRMIMNNFLTMQQIRNWKDRPLDADLVCEIHRSVTAETFGQIQWRTVWKFWRLCSSLLTISISWIVRCPRWRVRSNKSDPQTGTKFGEGLSLKSPIYIIAMAANAMQGEREKCLL
jgi:hypothetical protein